MYNVSTQSNLTQGCYAVGCNSIWEHYQGGVVERSDYMHEYGSSNMGGVVKNSDCILVYGSTTKGGVVKRFDCIY